jgi:methyltransferase (TIGR00027 family)
VQPNAGPDQSTERYGTVAAVLFRTVQLFLLPIAIVGYVMFVVRLITYSRRFGTSATVLASFYTRYMQHKLGTRRDEPCLRLMQVLPNVHQIGLRLETAPTLVAHWLTGYVPTIYRYPYPGEPPMGHQPAARTTFFDRALARRLDSIDQVVILGAGLDTRLYRLPEGRSLRRFEVDAPANQAFKREMLTKAGVDQSGVTFVAADFLKKRWADALRETGFDPERPAFFVWESVSMYLDRPTVEDTLSTIARMLPGTAVAFDYLSSELIDSRSPWMRYARSLIQAGGERWTFGIDNTPPIRPRVAALVEACGLIVEEQHMFEQETERTRALAGFVVAHAPDRLERQSA